MTLSIKPALFLIIKNFLLPLIVLLLSLTVIFPAAAGGHSLEIIGGQITVVPDKSMENRMLANITVRNNGPEITELIFKAVGEDGKNVPLQVIESEKAIGPYSVAQFKIEFLNLGSEKITGHLIIEANNVIPAVEAITLDPTLQESEGKILGIASLDTSAILLISFLAGFVLMALGTFIHVFVCFNRKGLSLREMLELRMSGLNWDFKENWASTFVALSGILGAVVGSGILSESITILSKQGFQVLNILFPILIVLAPFLLIVLNTLAKEPMVDSKPITDENGKSPLLIIPFIIGSAIVAWAITGELVTLIALFQELDIEEVLAPEVTLAGQISIILIVGLGLGYVWKKVVQTSLTAKKPVDLWGEPPSEERAEITRRPELATRQVYLP